MTAWRRIALRVALGLVAIAAAVLAVWSLAIGPVAVWRVLTHGTTTVWDHLEYPGRRFGPSAQPVPWPAAELPSPPTVVVDGDTVAIDDLLADTGSLALVVVRDGAVAYEWYAPGHGPDRVSMIFSVTKSVLSLLVGAAIDDGIIASVDDPVTDYVPELAGGGFGTVTIEDLLRMDTNLAYVEDDNPFGIHVEFNYTDDLEGDIVGLAINDQPDEAFRYKSGDNAVLGLVLDRALGETSITDYFYRRLWDPIGAETGGIWSTDREGGLERTWCCLAVSARDLARLGELVLEDGSWAGDRIISSAWLEASFEPAYDTSRWPAEYDGSPLRNYGYQWWLTDTGARVALGKDGQYLYIDPASDLVAVRLGETRGGISWLAILEQLAADGPDPSGG